jgi:hypothetical protein
MRLFNRVFSLLCTLPLSVSMYCEYLDPNMHAFRARVFRWLSFFVGLVDAFVYEMMGTGF